MSRKTIYSLFACLLFLLPTLVKAQSLSRYEYWFDDDFSGRVIQSISGTDEIIELSLNTDQLDYGIHKFSFRTRQSGSDYPYSAITSSLFLKRPAAQNSMVEYWFDDNFDQRDVMDISSTEDEQELSFDLRDNNKYPWGFHKLNMRITLEGGGESAVYSSGVLKLSAGKATTLECWLDDNRENLFPIEGHLASDGQDYLFVSDLDFGDIPYGLHRLHCRAVSNSGKTVSAISSSLFLKRPAAKNSMMEYWFDDNIDQKDVIDISSTEEEQELSLDLRDNNKYPWGFHKLNMRITLEGGGESAVYSSGVLKLSAGKATTLEYWLDDDRDNVRTLSGSLASDGQDYLFVDDLEMGNVSPGLHRLYCRAVSNSGKTASAVTSSLFLKMPEGTATSLEYWLDGDRKTVRTFSGETASDGQDYLFVSDLDLGAVTPGHHRLYCRAVGNDGKNVSAITVTPIMVKSKYHVDDPSTLTVTRQAYWIDDGEPVEKPVTDPEELMNFNHPVNKRQLSVGEHTIHMQYANSAGLWSSVGDLTITKEEDPAPVIQLSATEDKGLVTLNYNTVPYGIKYVVARKYPSGKPRKVGGAEDDRFPLALTATDTPPSGTYTYFVRGQYYDEDGEVKDIYSNDVTVSVAEADNSVKRVNVNVRVVFDNGKNLVWSEDNLRVHFSDGSSKSPNNNGFITLENIPVGTEMTMSIPFRAGCNYVADEKTFYVTENSPKQTIELLAKENDERVTVTDASDLITEGEISKNPDSWYAKIGNGTGEEWKGKVFMRMVSKSDFEKLTSYFNHNVSPDGGSGIVTPAEIPNTKLFINNMLTWKVAYQTDFSINKNGLADHEMFVEFITLPHPDRDKMEDYYVFFSSLKDGDTREKPMEGENPKVLRFNPHDITHGDVDEMERFCYYYAKVLKNFDYIKNWDDPVKLTWNSLKEGQKDIIALANKPEVTAEEANRIMQKYMVDEAGLTAIGLFGKSLKSKIKTVKQLKEMPDDVYNLFNEIQQLYAIRNAPPYHQFFKIANLIVNKSKTPFGKVYSAYLTVGEAMAKKIEELENCLSNERMWQYFADGHVTCKIRIASRDKNNEFLKYFDPYVVKDHIKSAKIEGFWRQYDTQPFSEDRKATSMNLDISPDDEGYWQLNIKGSPYLLSHFKNSNYAMGYEIWLVIEWKDGNVIRVPLLDQRVVERKEYTVGIEGYVTFSVELCSGFYQNKYMTKDIHFDDK